MKDMEKEGSVNPKDNLYPESMTGENVVTEYFGKTWAGFEHMKSPAELENADAEFQKMDNRP